MPSLCLQTAEKYGIISCRRVKNLSCRREFIFQFLYQKTLTIFGEYAKILDCVAVVRPYCACCLKMVKKLCFPAFLYIDHGRKEEENAHI